MDPNSILGQEIAEDREKQKTIKWRKSGGVGNPGTAYHLGLFGQEFATFPHNLRPFHVSAAQIKGVSFRYPFRERASTYCPGQQSHVTRGYVICQIYLL